MEYVDIWNMLRLFFHLSLDHIVCVVLSALSHKKHAFFIRFHLKQVGAPTLLAFVRH
jgi:hypothetical protein